MGPAKYGEEIWVDGVMQSRAIVYQRLVAKFSDTEARKALWADLANRPEGITLSGHHVTAYRPAVKLREPRRSKIRLEKQQGEPLLQGHCTHALGHWEL